MLVEQERYDLYFDGYERSAWRFEAQPTYTMSDENVDLSRFLAGEPMPPDFNEEWHERVRSMVAAGKTIARVRTVRRPLTDYQRYQFAWVVPSNMGAGEDVRILDLTELELDLPTQDFWIFDETAVVQLNFRPDGTLMSREQPEDSTLETYLTWRNIALAHSVPFREWNPGT